MWFRHICSSSTILPYWNEYHFNQTLMDVWEKSVFLIYSSISKALLTTIAFICSTVLHYLRAARFKKKQIELHTQIAIEYHLEKLMKHWRCVLFDYEQFHCISFGLFLLFNLNLDLCHEWVNDREHCEYFLKISKVYKKKQKDHICVSVTAKTKCVEQITTLILLKRFVRSVLC